MKNNLEAFKSALTKFKYDVPLTKEEKELLIQALEEMSKAQSSNN